jgi:hypothetical protein
LRGVGDGINRFRRLHDGRRAKWAKIVGKTKRVDCLGSTGIMAHSWNIEVVNSLRSGNSYTIRIRDIGMFTWSQCGFGLMWFRSISCIYDMN